MNCPQCGNEIPAGATDCPYCRAAAQAGNYAGQPATNGMAVASLVLALVGFFCVPFIGPLLGLIFGIIALNKINGNPGVWKGSGMAIAGIIISGIGVIYLPVLAAILFPVFAKARQKAYDTTCINNQRQIALSIQIWAQDNSSRFPPVNTVWQQLNLPSSCLICPTAGSTVHNAYGYNCGLDNRSISDPRLNSPEQLLLTADTVSSNTTNILRQNSDIAMRHNGGSAVMSFGDGHVALTSHIPNFIIPGQ